MQYVAKIIRHRHENSHYTNDVLKGVVEIEDHFKIVFSYPGEAVRFENWVQTNDGIYDFDKEACVQSGQHPSGFDCWCDAMQFYLLHVAGYEFHSTITPYKGEVYIRNEKE